jgi:Mn2+/Fe2+ NRAMP family transporter
MRFAMQVPVTMIPSLVIILMGVDLTRALLLSQVALRCGIVFAFSALGHLRQADGILWATWRLVPR